MSSAKEEFVYLPSKGPTSFDKGRMHASRIDVLLCFRDPTELAQGFGESCIGGGACAIQSKICLERRPICRGDLCVALVSVANSEVLYFDQRVGSFA
jgi:hypothetical protein